MANTITILFEPCEPAPANGYRISYRPRGSAEPYRIWPVNFLTSPAVFTDPADPDGTAFEGYIQGDCGSGFGIEVPWETDGGSDVSGSGVGGGGSDVDCGGAGIVVVTNNATGVTIQSVNNIAGFSSIPPPLLPGSSRSGTHTAFTAAVQFSVSGSLPDANMVLFQNETLVGCIKVNAAGLYEFPSTTFDTCDTILLVLTNGDCL